MLRQSGTARQCRRVARAPRARRSFPCLDAHQKWHAHACLASDAGSQREGPCDANNINDTEPVMTPSRTASAALLAAALLVPGFAAAQNSPWMIGVRAIGILPDDSSDIPGLSVDDRWTPELNFTYFVNRNFAFELIAATAKHEITLDGTSIGRVGHVPPTLTAQWHFTDLGAFKPYVGAGLNYTFFYDKRLANGTLEIEDGSFGGAVQVGFDYALDKNWSLNLDAKYIWIETDVKVVGSGARVGNVEINPLVIGLGARYRF